MVQEDLEVLGDEGNNGVQKPLKGPLVGPTAFGQDHPAIPANENDPIFKDP